MLNDCEINALFLHNTIHEMIWEFTGNYCFEHKNQLPFFTSLKSLGDQKHTYDVFENQDNNLAPAPCVHETTFFLFEGRMASYWIL